MAHRELEELEKRYAYKREKHSSYNEGLTMRQPEGSPAAIFPGHLPKGSYYIDRAGQKLMREELS